jgi:hypothetical protein
VALRRLLIAGVAALALAGPATAAADVHVAAGQHVGRLTVVADDVRVDGVATGSVTVIDGNLVVGPTGEVRQRVVVIGGHATVLPGGHIGGDVFQVGSPAGIPRGEGLLLFLVVGLVLRGVLAWLVISLAQLLLRERRIAAVAREALSYPVRTLLVGVLAGFGIGAASLLLAITLLGLVAAAALWGLLLAAGVVGMTIVLVELGGDARAARLLGLALFLPVVGEALSSLATVAALGALIRTAARPAAIARLGPAAP